MKNYLILLAGIALFLMAGCNKPRQIRQERTFVTENWQKFDTVRYNIDGQENEKPRDLNLIVRFNSLYQSRSLPVTILIQAPDGSESVIEKTIWLRNPDDTPRGELTGAASWNYTYCFRKAYEFTVPGVYKILIDNKTGKYDNPGIESISFEALPTSDREATNKQGE
jgi:gliding motility-associated lipoprotein GldH